MASDEPMVRTPEAYAERIQSAGHFYGINALARGIIDDLLTDLASARAQGRRDGIEAAASECERHAEFLKKEAHAGGSYSHLMDRHQEAVYLAGTIRALTGDE
jgi:hypothetical protein